MTPEKCFSQKESIIEITWPSQLKNRRLIIRIPTRQSEQQIKSPQAVIKRVKGRNVSNFESFNERSFITPRRYQLGFSSWDFIPCPLGRVIVGQVEASVLRLVYSIRTSTQYMVYTTYTRKNTRAWTYFCICVCLCIIHPNVLLRLRMALTTMTVHGSVSLLLLRVHNWDNLYRPSEGLAVCGFLQSPISFPREAVILSYYYTGHLNRQTSKVLVEVYLPCSLWTDFFRLYIDYREIIIMYQRMIIMYRFQSFAG